MPRVSPGAGQLAPLQTLSTLPEGWEGGNTCSHIHLTPDGRFLYSCNRGHDSLAAFAVDGDTGGLERAGRVETGPVAWLLAARLG